MGLQAFHLNKSRYLQTTSDAAFFAKQAALFAIDHLMADKRTPMSSRKKIEAFLERLQGLLLIPSTTTPIRSGTGIRYRCASVLRNQLNTA